MKPHSTADLVEYLPHRQPLVWIDEVLSYADGDEGPRGVCRLKLEPGRHFFDQEGRVRVSSPIEWVAQGYGYVKSCLRIRDGLPPPRGRAFLVGVTDVNVDLAGIAGQKSVLVHVRETRNLHPAYLLEGSVTSEDGTRTFARLKMKVFAGELEQGG